MKNAFFVFLFLALGCTCAFSQVGRRPAGTESTNGTSINVIAKRKAATEAPITAKQVSLYDGNVEQSVKSFSRDPSGARIVLLVDNSMTVPADVGKLEAAAREFVYEIYDGDKLLVVGYDEEGVIIADWTDDAKILDASLKSFRKKGQPHLFDALLATAQAMQSVTEQKRVIVVISDGLDRGSKTSFEQTLATLQSMDIAVYVLQAPDRTRGASHGDSPKPKHVVEQLVEGTGGLVFPIDQPKDAAKAICDELRQDRYTLAYSPSNVLFSEARSLLVLGEEGITLRSKTMQPPH